MEIETTEPCETDDSMWNEDEETKENGEILHFRSPFGKFDSLPKNTQSKFVESLLRRMTNSQHVHIDGFIKQMLQKDFIGNLAEQGFCMI